MEPVFRVTTCPYPPYTGHTSILVFRVTSKECKGFSDQEIPRETFRWNHYLFANWKKKLSAVLLVVVCLPVGLSSPCGCSGVVKLLRLPAQQAHQQG